jgi:hypothetical protein
LANPVREVNQLFAPAIACRTLSSLPFVEVEPAGSSPPSFGESSASAGSVETAESAEEPFDLPMSSAGSGTLG